MTAFAVIGAGFGDEGKGLITDHLTRHLAAETVVRFNGGGQASHTVVTPHGMRHVFNTASAGTFAGASTYLGPRFILNPYLLDAEMADLRKLKYVPDVFCHPAARVTTIFDMALNAAAELSRGDGRHGSCGVGINETVTRHERGYRLTAGELRRMSRKQLSQKLKEIHGEWVPTRLKELGLSEVPDSFHLHTGEVLKNGNYDEHVIRLLMGALHVAPEMVTPSPIEHVVLEGAQGLMLDEHLGKFPHVTRSMTGLPYALEAAGMTGQSRLVPVYVTRAYATRHGAGELKHHGEPISEGGGLIDTTNVFNDWQGKIRFAPLDLRELKRFIDEDLKRGRALVDDGVVDVKIKTPMIALTCLDQLGEHVAIYDEQGEPRCIESRNLPAFVTEALGMNVTLVSRGPSSNFVEHLSQIGV